MPLPLAGEVDALVERGGWGKSLHAFKRTLCGNTPTPTLPRARGEGAQRRKPYIRITAWRSILPVPVFGNSPVNLISRGYLYGRSFVLT